MSFLRVGSERAVRGQRGTSAAPAPESIAHDYMQRAVSFQRAHTQATEQLRSSPSMPARQQTALVNSLFRTYLALESSYAGAARSLRSRSALLGGVQTEHAKAVHLALTLFPDAEHVRSAQAVRGLNNAGGNCPFNSLLQMLFSAPTLINALMRAPELSELRRAYLQYTGVLPGPINTQALRRELHGLNPLISLNPDRWEDAQEVLSTMLRYVPAELAEETFPTTQLTRTYSPDAVGRDVDVAHASQFIQDEVGTYTLREENPSPFLFIDPVAGGDGVAPFEDILQNAFDADASEDGEVGFMHDGDDVNRHFHQPLRSLRSYQTTPEQLIINLRRFQYDGIRGTIRVDTPLQMPRVLTLPEGSVRDESDRRMLLRSFVLYKPPGHYVTYVRRGEHWYYCSDTTTRRTTLAEVDKALCYTSNGGSYLHYYERAEAEVLDAEPEMTEYDPRPDVERARIAREEAAREARLVATPETRIVQQLLTTISTAGARRRSHAAQQRFVESCFGHFSRLSQTTQYRCYELLFRERIINDGIEQFLQNPKSILPLLAEFGDDEAASSLAALLQEDDVNLEAAFNAFMRLHPDQQMRCYELLCRQMIIEQGIDEFLANPIALLKRVKANGRTMSIIDHMVRATKRDRDLVAASARRTPARTTGSGSTGAQSSAEVSHSAEAASDSAPVSDSAVDSDPAPAVVVARPRFQRQVYDLLEDAIREGNKPLISQYWGMLDEKYQRLICLHVAQARSLTGEDLAARGLALINEDLSRDRALFAAALRSVFSQVVEDTPLIPRADEIRVILQRAFRGDAYDVEAFDALITEDHVNDYWPEPKSREVIKQGSILQYIAKHPHITNAEHLRPLLERLARKGLDFNSLCTFGNPAWIWAIANANYDVARVIIEVARDHGADFTVLGRGNNAVHLLIAKGYQSRSRDGQRFTGNGTGTVLLRLLLAVSPDSLNARTRPDGYTPLHIAALRRDLEFCRILREFDANPNVTAANGETPLDMLNKTAEEAGAILNRLAGVSEFSADCFSSEIGPQIVNAIRSLFREETSFEVATQLLSALQADLPDDVVQRLVGKLEPKYRTFLIEQAKRKVRNREPTLADLKRHLDVVGSLIERILADSERSAPRPSAAARRGPVSEPSAEPRPSAPVSTARARRSVTAVTAQ